MNAKKTEWLIGIMFSGMGLIFFIVGIFFAINTVNFKNNAVETTAVITSIDTYEGSDGDTHHNVYVKYTVRGEQYEERLNFYTSGMRKGKEVTIYYDPFEPSRIMAKSSYDFSLFFFPLFGLVFFIVGFGFILKKIMKTKTRKYLLENGELVYADITEIKLNLAYRVNGRNPYIIICKWKDPSTDLFYFFISDNIWFDPEPILSDRDIRQLPVYIDRNNPKKYTVSIKELEDMVAVM